MIKRDFMSDASFDYASTFLLTILASAANLLVVAILARTVNESDFLDFSLLQRYFGFLAIAANLAVGFALIQLSKDEELPVAQGIAKLCRWLVSGWSLILFVGWIIFLDVFTPLHETSLLILGAVFIYVITQAQYHVSAPYARRMGGIRQFLILFAVARVVASLVGVALVLIFDKFWVWYIGYALVSQLYQWKLWSGNVVPPVVDRIRQVWSFSSSRWVEGMLRTALPIVIILLCQRQFGHQIAGYIAVIYAFVKTLESVLQPLVISIMMRRKAANSSNRLIWVSVLFTVVLSALIYISKGLIEYVFGLLLGSGYLHLTEFAWITMFSSGALISLNLLRAKYDNDYPFSPLLVINLLCMFAVVFLMPMCSDILDVVMLIVAVHFSRWILYMIFLMTTGSFRGGQENSTFANVN